MPIGARCVGVSRALSHAPTRTYKLQHSKPNKQGNVCQWIINDFQRSRCLVQCTRRIAARPRRSNLGPRWRGNFLHERPLHGLATLVSWRRLGRRHRGGAFTFTSIAHMQLTVPLLVFMHTYDWRYCGPQPTKRAFQLARGTPAPRTTVHVPERWGEVGQGRLVRKGGRGTRRARCSQLDP